MSANPFAFLKNCNPVWNIQREATDRACRECGERKQMDQFYLNGKTSTAGVSQRYHRCRVCMIAKQIARNRK